MGKTRRADRISEIPQGGIFIGNPPPTIPPRIGIERKIIERVALGGEARGVAEVDRVIAEGEVPV